MTDAHVPAEEWITSTDEERWNGREDYATREEAIRHGPKEHDLQPGETYFVGRKAEMKLTRRWGERICEDLGELAYKLVDEDAEGWPGATNEQVKELTAEVQKLIEAWLDRHGLRPGFYQVERVTEHEAPEVETA